MNKEPIRKPFIGGFVILLGLLSVWIFLHYRSSTAETVRVAEGAVIDEAHPNSIESFVETNVSDEPTFPNITTVSNNSTTVANTPSEISLEVPHVSSLGAESIQPIVAEQANPAPILPNPFTNSWGMRFVTVPQTKVLFSAWVTRVQDYQTFVTETQREWPKPKWPTKNFQQELTHPAVMNSWHDAKAFCHWLTEKDRREGQFGDGIVYRLPTVGEWSVAACGAMSGDETLFPWGNQWPPLAGAGNYSQRL